jgi:Kef-type K+ transport system membrane component KefB
MNQIDPASFLVIVTIAGAAGLICTALDRRMIIPVVVIELVLGILIGPQVARLAGVNQFTSFFGDIGLAMLFFFAGYEIDLERVRGRPLELASAAWALSLALAFGIGAVLALLGVVLSLLYTGAAMATTALGTLVPMLKDSGDARSRFGTYLLASGAVGEFGPIVLVTLFLSTGDKLIRAALLLLFAVVAGTAGVITLRSTRFGWEALERTFETSSQLAVRLLMVLIFGLVALAFQLGLDLLLGGFVAGLIVRLAVQGREVKAFESKITAIGYGFLIPFFFITSGMRFDGASLVGDPEALLTVPLFVGLFLVVRGVPALLLYRGPLALRDRIALGLFSATELPLVVAITTIAVAAHHMHPVTAAALVGAGIVSTIVFPLIAMRLRKGRIEPLSADADATPTDATATPAVASGVATA